MGHIVFGEPQSGAGYYNRRSAANEVTAIITAIVSGTVSVPEFSKRIASIVMANRIACGPARISFRIRRKSDPQVDEGVSLRGLNITVGPNRNGNLRIEIRAGRKRKNWWQRGNQVSTQRIYMGRYSTVVGMRRSLTHGLLKRIVYFRGLRKKGLIEKIPIWMHMFSV